MSLSGLLKKKEVKVADVKPDGGTPKTNPKMAKQLMTDPYKWSVDEVGQWLDSMNFSSYKASWKANEVSGDTLMDITDGDLLALKVTNPAERARLLLAIQQLKMKWGRQLDGNESESETRSGSSMGSSASHGSQGSATTKKAELTFKVVFGEETHVVKAPPNIPLEKLSRKVRRLFGHRMYLRYRDSDGDLITVKNDEELKVLVEASKNADNIRLVCVRKSKESVLEKTETAILETMVNPVVVIDKNATVLFANGGALRTFGYRKEELEGKNVKMLIPPGVDRDHHDEYVARYLRTGVGSVIGKGRPVEGLRKDGTRLRLELMLAHGKSRKRDIFTATFSELRSDAGPSPASAASAAHSSNLMQAGLSASFALLDNMLFAAIVADDKGCIQYVNSNAATMFGYEKAHMLGKNVRMLMPEPDSTRHDGYIKAYLTSMKPKVIGRSRDVIGMRKDGTLIAINLGLTEQVLDSSRIFTAMLRQVDQNDAQHAEAKSVLQQEREVLQNLSVAAVIVDEKGTIQAFNAAAETMWGYRLAEVVGRNCRMLMPSPDRERHDGYLKRYLEGGKSKVIGLGRDVIALHKDGTMMPVRLSVTEKRDGEKRFWTGIAQRHALAAFSPSPRR